MASTLAAPTRPLSSASNRSSAGSTPGLPAPTRHHTHSLSSSTPTTSRATPAYQHPNHGSSSSSAGYHSPAAGGLSPSLGSTRPRQSLDAARMLGGGPLSPRLGASAGGGIRPNSEMLGLGGMAGQGFGVTPETEAIDRWFEDLQSYEATLEEMAAASLDPNFKEELSAIEQWFRVLSEAERTAALYSLLQSSTQVQIRFFITVLQQMARSDPMSALLSPSTAGNTPSMEQQMEAKLAQLSTKSPVSPVVRQFARQSLGASVSPSPGGTPSGPDAFLSPHHAAISSSNGDSPNGVGEAASLLASQRAKLKANNRVSAPGMLSGQGTPTSNAGSESGLKSPKWGTPASGDDNLDVGHQHSRSPSPAGRPKSLATGNASEAQSQAQVLAQMQQNQAALARALAMTSNMGSHLGISLPPSSAGGAAGGLEGQLSPIVGGSWASQVNTPLVPMFGAKEEEAGQQQGLGEAANKLAAWGAAHQATGGPNASAGAGAGTGEGGIQLDDARKFRRPSKAPSPQPPATSSPTTGFNGGVLANMGGGNIPATSSTPSGGVKPSAPLRSPSLPTPATAGGMGVGVGVSAAQNTNPNPLAAQAAAMAAQQNWRNNLAALGGGAGVGVQGGGGDPGSAGLANNFAMMGLMNGMGGMNMNDPNNAAAIQNMANLLQMQQQMQQVQQLQALQQQIQQQQAAQQQQKIGLMSPVSARLGMGFPNGGFPSPAAASLMGQQLAALNAAAAAGGKRSPGLGLGSRSPNAGNKPSHHVPGSGSNPEEELDMKLLSDIPAWLRGLRLHKYTPNFEKCTWQEMVMMTEADLEARGVAAVGARRKMLRTFETVRLKKGMALPGDGEPKPDAPEASSPPLEKSEV